MEKSFEGYKSKSAKNKFMIISGLLGIAFFIGQIILPMILGMGMIPAMLFSRRGDEIDRVFVKSAIIYRDSIWMTGRRFKVMKGTDTGKDSINLYSYIPGPESELMLEMNLSMETPHLLSIKDSLWVIDEDLIYVQTGSEFSIITPENSLTEIKDVFNYHGFPGVIDSAEDKVSVKYFKGGQWQEHRVLFEKNIKSKSGSRRNFKYAEFTDQSFIFMSYGKVLYYDIIKSSPASSEFDSTYNWKTLALISGDWNVQQLNEELYVFVKRNLNSVTRAEFYKWTGTAWENVYTEKLSSYNLTRYLVYKKDEYIVLISDIFGPTTYHHIVNGHKSETYQFGESSAPFDMGYMMIYAIGIQLGRHVFPLILALIFSVLMKKFRVPEHKAESFDEQATFAPLWKRGLAMITDTAMIMIPLIYFYFDFFAEIFTVKNSLANPFMMQRKMLTIMLFVFLAWLGSLFIFSFFEGFWGKTPGKWIFKIKVVNLDHKRLGLGRALIRNFLKIVDGFFNFMVGIMLVAITRDWQRIGDLAADSIVINDIKQDKANDG